VSNFGYWQFNGRNGLLGAADTQEELPDGRIATIKDPENPTVLQDEYILLILRTVKQARFDFTRLFPDLDVDSQDRLTNLVLSNPRLSSLMVDDQSLMDALQKKDVTSGVHLEPPRR